MIKPPLAALLALCLMHAQSGTFAGAKAGDERSVDGVKLVWCPAGRFRMGSPPGEAERRPDEAQVDVTLTKGFWMGKFEVTQAQWSRISGPFIQEMNKGKGDDVPVYWVNYLEAEDFCRRLSAHGWEAGSLPRDWEFRLPTEAQWEYACRAGSTTATAFGDTMTAAQANFDGRPDAGSRVGGVIPGGSVKAGSYPANAWGLHDMHGNVWEWCRDYYHSYLPGGTDPDLFAPKGQANRDGTYSRVRRGGAWIEAYQFNRSATRLKYEPERRSDHIGFRIVAVPR
ncbi:MAG: formylglycine-generating enzyme family protein [Candidatus Solibacter sp.]